MTSPPYSITVVAPVRNEARFVDRCLPSILEQDDDRIVETLLVDGRSDDDTRCRIDEMLTARGWDTDGADRWVHPGNDRSVRGSVRRSVRLVDNPDRIVPHALNLGIRAASGNIIARMDAHSLYPPDYVRRCVDGLIESGADNYGGVAITVASDEAGAATASVTARAIAAVTSHPLGVGGSRFRTGGGEPGPADTVPFGVFHRSLFDRIGFFDERLARNQDNEFNARIRAAGGSVILDPSISFRYFNQSRLIGLARQGLRTGFWNAITLRLAPHSFRWRYVLPSVFVVGQIAALALLALGIAFSLPVAIALGIAPFILYAGAWIAAMPAIARESGAGAAWLAPWVAWAYQTAYGVGGIAGLLALVGGSHRRLGPGPREDVPDAPGETPAAPAGRGPFSGDRLLLVIVLVGILLRLGVLAYRWDSPLSGEAADYLADALRILENPAGWIPRRPIGLPACMAIILRLGGDPASLRWLSFGFGVAVLVATARLASRCCGRCMLAATTMVAVSPALVIDSTEPLSQAPVALAGLLVLLLLGRERPVRFGGRGIEGAAIGLIIGVASLFRTSAAPLLLLPWFGAIGRGGRRRAIWSTLVLTAVVGGFAARNSSMAGSPMGLNSLDSKNLFYGNNRYTPLYRTWVQGNRPEKATGTDEERRYLARPFVVGDPAATSRNYARAALREIGSRPDLFAVRTVNRARCWFGFDTNGGATLLHTDRATIGVALATIGFEAVLWTVAGSFAIIVIVLGWTGRIPDPWDGVRFLPVAVVLLALPYFIAFSHPTYHAPAAPLVFILGAAGLVAVREHPGLVHRYRRRVIIGVSLFVLIQLEWFLMMVDRIRVP